MKKGDPVWVMSDSEPPVRLWFGTIANTYDDKMMSFLGPHEEKGMLWTSIVETPTPIGDQPHYAIYDPANGRFVIVSASRLRPIGDEDESR